MLLRRGVTKIANQGWVAKVDEIMSKGTDAAFSSLGGVRRYVENGLHGTWLGHPVHPAITDLPVGAWTSAAVLDALDISTGRKQLGQAADLMIGIGLAGAVGAGITGITDWNKTDEPARKMGVIHGLMNIEGAWLYTAALILRRRGQRGAGQALAALAYSGLLLSAWIGGELSYKEGVGIDHGVRKSSPKEFTPVLAEAELPENTLKRVRTKGVSILLVHQEGKILAINEVCSHLGGPLSEGELDGNCVICPWHGSEFSLEDGHVVGGPATYPVDRYETRIRDGQIEVRHVPNIEG